MPLKRIPRRTFLRASGVAIDSPLLDAMAPRLLRAAKAATSPKRMVMIARPLGLYAAHFFPETTGPDYQASRYLKLIDSYRKDFTVFSGMSHHYGGGHGTLAGMLTGVKPEDMPQGNIRNSISLDQEVAAQLDAPTRFSSLILGMPGLSWNRKGVVILP